jgi:DNA-binding transcriptional LysR family regulator
MTRSERVSQRLKLQQLRVFLAVAQTGGMAKAAKQLATSQSVVSKTIAELENVLGVRLIDRTAQGAELTRYGRTLLTCSSALFDELKAGVSSIDFLANPDVGELRVGTTEPQSGIVVGAIQRLTRQYSQAEFKVMVGADAQTLIDRELRGRNIDLVVAPSPKPIPKDLETMPLYRNRLRVVASMKSPWARRRNISFADLANEPWCAPPLDLPGGAHFLDAFLANGLPAPRVVLSCTANHLCHAMLEDGRFLGISSDGYLAFNTQRLPLKVLPVDLPAPLFEVAIITLKQRTISPLARLFADCARDIAKPLANRRSSKMGGSS